MDYAEYKRRDQEGKAAAGKNGVKRWSPRAVDYRKLLGIACRAADCVRCLFRALMTTHAAELLDRTHFVWYKWRRNRGLSHKISAGWVAITIRIW